MPLNKPMTVEEYFEFEKAASERHEYMAGEVYPMSDVSQRHNQIVGNILLRLRASAKGGPCQCTSARSSSVQQVTMHLLPRHHGRLQRQPDMDARSFAIHASWLKSRRPARRE